MLAAFARLIVKGRGFDESIGGGLRRLFELRNVADYSWLDAPEPGGDDALAVARAFVAAVERWLAER